MINLQSKLEKIAMIADLVMRLILRVVHVWIFATALDCIIVVRSISQLEVVIQMRYVVPAEYQMEGRKMIIIVMMSKA